MTELNTTLSQSELNYLKDLVNSGDRAGYYVAYYNMTGSDQSIEQARQWGRSKLKIKIRNYFQIFNTIILHRPRLAPGWREAGFLFRHSENFFGRMAFAPQGHSKRNVSISI